MRKYLILFALSLIYPFSVFGFQSGEVNIDSVNTDTAIVLSDSVADTLNAFSVLTASIEELKKNQNELSSNFDSVQSAILNLSSTESASTNYWLYGTILLLSLIALTSIVLSYYLYRTRTILINDTKALVPEKWGGYLESVGNALKKINQNIEKRLKGLEQITQGNTEKLESMIETYLSLQKALDEKDSEIKRLKKGYDKELYRKFLYRFIKVDQTLSEIMKEGEISAKELEMVKRLMEDAFVECGVERFKPEVGEDYTSIEGVNENPVEIPSQNKEDEYRIAEVEEEGYRLNGGDQSEILVPAKVKIYVNNN